MSDVLTVIMPTLNAERYLEQTLKSLADQTYTDFDLWVWDNGSTDRTVEMLHQWIPSRINGRVITGKPLGLGASLARMLLECTTKYCARMDADDIALPSRFEKQISYLDQHPEIALCGTLTQWINTESQVVEGAPLHPCDDAGIRWRLRFSSSIIHPTVMFRPQAILDAGNYQDITPGQDIDLWLRLIQKYKVANIPEVLLSYRKHAQSISDVTRRKLFTRYVAELLPGIERVQAMRLHDLLVMDTDQPAHWSDIRALKTSAIMAARQVHMQPSYFIRTDVYQNHRHSLIMRCVKNNALGRMWTRLRKGAGSS